MRPAIYKFFALSLFVFQAAFASATVLSDEQLATTCYGAAYAWQLKSSQFFGNATSAPLYADVSILSNKQSSARSGVVPFSNGGYIVFSSTNANEMAAIQCLAISTSGSFNPNSPLGKILTGQKSTIKDLKKYPLDTNETIRVSSGDGFDESLVKTIDITKLDIDSLEIPDDAPEYLKTGIEAIKKTQSGRKGGKPLMKDARPFGSDDDEVGDLRVRPLLKTAWGQDSVFSNYTPSNYVCGCVATMLGQVMYYHKYPAGEVSVISNRIFVNGVAQTVGTRGGTYDWDSMTLTSSAAITPAASDAMAKLVSDAGISVHMQYSADGSGSFMPDAFSALTNQNCWAYSNAVIFSARDGYTTVGIDFNYHTGPTWDMILGSLNAGYPVCLGIAGDAGGHAIVCDGYGFMHDTNSVEQTDLLYLHLNMGWDGSGDAWYNMPVFIAAGSMTFTKLDEMIYNIFPTNKGEVVSGRIVDTAGAPVTNATVTVTLPDTTSFTTETSDTGVWAVIVPSDTNCSVSVSAPSYKSASKDEVQIKRSINELTTDGHTGNIWNCDFALQDADNADVVFSPYSEDGSVFTGSVDVSLSCAEIGGSSSPEIWYSTNGVDYALYAGPLTFTVSTEISAYGVYSSVTGKTYTAKYVSDSLGNGIDDEINNWKFTDTANWTRVEGFHIVTQADPDNDDCAMCVATVPGQTNSISVVVDGEGTLSFALGGYFQTDDIGFVGVAVDGKYKHLVGAITNKYDSLAADYQMGSSANNMNNANWTNIVLNITGTGTHKVEIIFVSTTFNVYPEMNSLNAGVTHQLTTAYLNYKGYAPEEPLQNVYGIYMVDRLVWDGAFGDSGWSVLTPGSMMSSMTVAPAGTGTGKVLSCALSGPVSEVKVEYSATLSPPAFAELPSTDYDWDPTTGALSISLPATGDSGFYIIYYK